MRILSLVDGGAPSDTDGVQLALSALWTLAGVAMLVFVLFVAVLLVAAFAFRLWPGRTRRSPRRTWYLSSAVVLAVAAAVVVIQGRASHAADDVCASETVRHRLPAGPAFAESTTRSLVLYDGGGVDPRGAELSAVKLANLVSHFGSWSAHPVGAYTPGELAGYDAVLYIGDAPGASLPKAFLSDVLDAQSPVVWINDNIAQLHAYEPAAWAERYGFRTQGFDRTRIARVEYKDTALPVIGLGEGGVMRIDIDDPSTVTQLATAVRPDGTSLPWAVRSHNVLYIAENPLPYVGPSNDRYLALADLLFEALAPDAPARHRALVRLEDVGPTANPAQLRAIGQYLHAQQVPFSFGVYPVHRDPLGPTDTTIRLSERPEVVSAIQYLVDCGGTMVMHGYTHQYETQRNPYTGRSADDFEFYLASLTDGQLRLDGAVPDDSEQWALSRIDAGLAEFDAAGLPRPQLFEFPHYAASAADYRAAAQRFDYRYERTLYFPGLVSGTPAVDSRRAWQFFPYPVRDVYGTSVIPENLDYVVGADADRSATRILDAARANLVVRDGVASFFYHPFLGLGQLPRLVEGIRALGYTFVGVHDLAAP